MKRELAALEIGSPVLKSTGGKTRSCKQSLGVESERLVYKRTKRSSVQGEENYARRIRSNGVNGNLKDSISGNGNLSGASIKGESACDEGIQETLSVEMVQNEGLGNEFSPEKIKVVDSILMSNGQTEIKEDEIASDTLSLSPSNLASDDLRSFSGEKHPRRFTRSALKSNAGNLTEATEYAVPNGQNQMIVENGESKDSSADHLRGLCSDLKTEVEGMQSCTIVAGDLVSSGAGNIEFVANGVNTEALVEQADEESMSKQITLAKIPATVQELLETGLLEGCPVYYNGGKAHGLRGRIRSLGILCSCGLCEGRKVIPPSLFEIHACNSYKRAAQYICLENGRNFIQILRECKSTRLTTVEATVQNAIGPLPERKLVVCQNCREPFSTMDAERSEAVCSSCVMSNLSPIGPVFSFRKTSRFFKSVSPPKLSEAASSVLPKNQEKLNQNEIRSPNALLVPSLQNSPRSPEESFAPKLRSSPRFGMSSETKTAYTPMKKSSAVCLTPNLRSSPRLGKSSEAKVTPEIGKITQVSSLAVNTHDSPMRKSSEQRTREKPMRKLSSRSLSPRLSGSTRGGKSPRANYRSKTMNRIRKDVMPKPSKIPSIRGSSEKKTSGKITRKDLRQHRLVFEDDVLPDGAELGYYARGQKLLTGYKKGSGIYCSCCSTVVSASLFEAHAGCASRRKPYCYIYTSNGVSLHELSVSLIKVRTQSIKSNDDLCIICADGGNLLLCDGCPRSFHMQCASLPSIPRGKWYCRYCENMFEREKFVAHNANAVAAGRVSGVDPIEQITERSIRIVDNLGSEVSSCILCRGYDFCRSGFGPRTIILCDQCEKEYHVACLKDHKMADLKELPEGKWFCSMDCGKIDSALQNLLDRGAQALPESLANIIHQKCLQTDSECAPDFDVSWRLLSGKAASAETKTFLSQAVSIFHESFAPIIDTVSGRDLIPAMVYGRNVAGQEYGGMYCAVLTINSVVVSAGIFRVFGPEVAELPLVATSTGNHGKGYFQALFACIENLLGFLKVKSFVLPAAEEAESIWTDRFGFTKMTPDELCTFRGNFWSVVRFHGTSMLHKLIPESCVIQS